MCYDAIDPDCVSRVERKARKQHACCECGGAILPGQSYEYVSGIWDGYPADYKTCEACQILREHVTEEDGCNEHPPFTMLLEAAKESARQ